MTILVTGAGGLTGGEIARRFVAEGNRVIAVSRREPAVAGATSVIGDATDPLVLAPHLENADLVVHVAGILDGERLARMPGLGRVRRLVVVSSAAVYSAHRSSAAAYLAGERALAAVHPAALFVRPTMIYGSSRDRNIHHVIQFAHRFGLLPQIGEGDAKLQPIHFEDLTAATVALAASDRTGTVDAGGGAPIALRALLREVFAALGRPARVIRIPLTPALIAARVIDRSGARRVTERLERMAEERTVDNAALTAATAVRPRAFEQGVRDQVAAMRADGGLAS
jgi:nucleoside-diphosphate-sugar epimerase